LLLSLGLGLGLGLNGWIDAEIFMTIDRE